LRNGVRDKYQDLPDAPAPASTPAGRIRQMKVLADRFQVTMTGLKADRSDREDLHQPAGRRVGIGTIKRDQSEEDGPAGLHQGGVRHICGPRVVISVKLGRLWIYR
jgi:hypothetical protein